MRGAFYFFLSQLSLNLIIEDKQTFILNGNSHADEWLAQTELLNDKKRSVKQFDIGDEEIGTTGQLTTSRIGLGDLVSYYGELSPFDVVLKLAEYGNFNGARKEFQTWNEEFVPQADDYLTSSLKREREA